MEKQETIIDRAELFYYLDGFILGDIGEIIMAICTFIEEQEWKLYYSDMELAGRLADEYVEFKENQKN